ncbi:MAG: phosphate ABC transporter substrate-binding/OmpA family protein [Pseudomonadota bacterium]
MGGLLTAPAFAQEDVLRSQDGSLTLRGSILSADSVSFLIATPVGEVVVAREGVSCSGPGCPSEEASADTVEFSQFRIISSHGLEESLLLSLIESYSLAEDTDMLVRPAGAERTEVTLSNEVGEELVAIAIEPRTTAEAFEQLAISDAALAVTNRQIAGGEAQLIAALGRGDPRSDERQFVAALDGVVLVTSRDNPVKSLTEDEIAAVLAGQIDDWAQIGGDAGPITLFRPDDETGTWAVADAQIMADAGLALSPLARVLPTDAEVSDRVASDPRAIGVTTYSNLRSARAMLIEGACGIWAQADPFTIKTEEYPFTKRIYMYRSAETAAKGVDSFIAHLASAEAQMVIADAGFVDQGLSSVSVNAQGLRFVSAMLPSSAETSLIQLQEMMTELLAAERLSLTLRFLEGSSVFDPRGDADLKRLAEIIASGLYDRKEVLLVGFTDSRGDGGENRRLSQIRAEEAESRLRALLPGNRQTTARITSLGFGELSPLACNDTPRGRNVNRRVEVWVRDISR